MQRYFAAAGAALTLSLTVPVSAETLSQRSAESRVTLGYRVTDAAVQALLPAGWTLSGAGGPGANLTLIFTDRALYQTPEGQPIAGGRTRDVIFIASASNAAGQNRTFVVLTLSPERATPGPYGVSIPATFETRTQTVTGADEKPLSEQHWKVQLAEGGGLELDLRYERGPVRRGAMQTTGGQLVYSAKTPDFYRIYRTESGTDAVSAASPSRLRSSSLKVTGARLTTLLNGSERLVSMSETPYYLREVWLP